MKTKIKNRERKIRDPLRQKGGRRRRDLRLRSIKIFSDAGGKERTWARLSCITNLQLKLIPSLGAAE